MAFVADRRLVTRARRRVSRLAAGCGLLAALVTLGGCAHTAASLEISGAVVYDKPRIVSITHELEDARETGGGVTARIIVVGDPGLVATFDVTPDLAQNAPLVEVADGRYEATFDFPAETLGGPFTIVGHLKHELAGSATVRDETSITIPLPPRKPTRR